MLRACLGVALICFGAAGFNGNPSGSHAFAQDWIAAAAGILLLAGLWTPAMAALVAIDETWIALSLDSSQRADIWIHAFLAILAISVAMLGPGAWSIDARLFGRKRFDIDRSRDRKPLP